MGSIYDSGSDQPYRRDRGSHHGDHAKADIPVVSGSRADQNGKTIK